MQPEKQRLSNFLEETGFTPIPQELLALFAQGKDPFVNPPPHCSGKQDSSGRLDR
jgi:hypothetical protein